MKENRFYSIALACTMLCCCSCGNNQPAKETATESKKDSVTPKEEVVVEAKRAPVINIMDTVSTRKIILVIKDSAATMERISGKLGAIYGKLMPVLKKNNIKAIGSPMAWYTTQKPPYFFEAGLPVDKKPAKLAPGVIVKELGIDSVIVAHFYGPYDLLPQAYDAVKDMLTDRKKKLKGTPYEIYIDDPVDSTGKAKDPYKVLTDVVFPWK